jgi:phosphatidylserine/phosphatidylglycerophosphate/cardiolipin synthase-like enzyme
MKKTTFISKFFLIFILVFLIFVIGENFLSELFPKNKIETLLLKENMSSDITINFCPKDNCYMLFNDSFTNAEKSIECAFYELDSIDISKQLINLDKRGIKVSLVVDGVYSNEEAIVYIKDKDTQINIFSDGEKSSYMHHKFCIIDNTSVIVSSANPTENGLYHNNNNILKIDSKILASIYSQEFNNLLNNNFASNKKKVTDTNTPIILSYENNSYNTSIYFCPKNDCETPILNILKNSKSEIFLASFVLTLNSIEETLIQKSNQGVDVFVLIESRMQNIRGSNLSNLNKNLNLKIDTNPKTMHHKFFVVDKRYVITGSMNPTSSGIKKNDENLIIIDNTVLAKKFREEFLKEYNKSKNYFN